ncbi:MAG: cardiolipin synthase [Rhodobacteraceae bacterium]|nr:cardiolipin synthase [Paracoccaceae bacterium]
MLVVFGSLVAIAIYGSALFCAVHAAVTARTPQGAVGWGVFLIALPILGVPLYMFLGHHRFRGYRITRLESKRVVEGLKAFASQHRPDLGEDAINLAPFEGIANMQAVRGNGADLLIDGEATFAAIFEAIDAARDYILFQFYIVHDDVLGRAVKERLIAAARRGVHVRFLIDAVGSYKLPRAYSDDLRAAGIDVADRDSQRGPRFRFQLNYRNHRKTVVVDGVTGFIGGHNVGDEYMGRDPAISPWRDTHYRVRGPVVLQLQLIFVEDWHWATDTLVLDDLNWDARRTQEDMTALIVATGPGDATETGSMMFFSAIAAAQTKVWIASPYFVPDLDVMTALKHAALRGVDVRVLVPERADNLMTWLAAYAYYDEMTQSGVRLFRFTRGFMHQKAFLVDDQLAAVGTTNLDNRSFRLNFEAMALFFDRQAAAALEAMFRADFEHSYEQTRTIAQQPLHIRYGAPVARLFSPIL